jgi:RNA polymerase sigma-70 factor (ECF subfamily)
MTVLTVTRDADASLMAAYLRREPEASGALYDRYASRIYGLGLVLLRNKTDAEDLVQDTFLRVLRLGSRFDPARGSLDVWMLMVARNLAIDLIRRRTVEAKKLTAEPTRPEISDEPSPEWLVEQHDLVRRARKAMDQLPRGQRAALELAYFGERSSTEVAELEGIPTGTVKSRIRAGLMTLRREMGEATILPESADAIDVCCGSAAS